MKKAGLIAVIIFLCSFTSLAQQKEMTGMFEGHNGSAYSFSFGDEEYMYFDECDDAVLKEFDLMDDELLYESFTVTYVATENDEGETSLRIIGLVHLQDEE